MSDFGMVCLKGPEVRTFPYSALEMGFREVDGTDSYRFLEGRAVPYGRWADIGGWFKEQFAFESFKKSIREAGARLPLMLWHDNKKFPIGASTEWREKDDGLHGVWRIDTKDDLAVEAARKARDGFLTGMSVGFAPIEDLWEQFDGVDHVTRKVARLFEVSLTPTPAYAGGKVSLVRSRRDGERRLEQRRRSAEVDAWRRYLESITA